MSFTKMSLEQRRRDVTIRAKVTFMRTIAWNSSVSPSSHVLMLLKEKSEKAKKEVETNYLYEDSSDPQVQYAC